MKRRKAGTTGIADAAINGADLMLTHKGEEATLVMHAAMELGFLMAGTKIMKRKTNNEI